MKKIRVRVVRFDDDDAAKKAAEEAARKAAEDKKFTQEDVNRFLADDRRKHDQKYAAIMSELKKYQEGGMSAEEKQQFEQRFEQLRQSHLTKEQQLTEQINSIKEQTAKEKETLTKDRDSWVKRYSQEVIRRAIFDAATSKETKAVSPRQMVDMLESKIYLTEGLDDEGKPNGTFIPKMKFETLDDKKKPIVLELTVQEVFKRMKNLPEEYGNLFESEAKGGLGAHHQSGGKIDLDLKDPKAYREARKKNGIPEIGGR